MTNNGNWKKQYMELRENYEMLRIQYEQLSGKIWLVPKPKTVKSEMDEMISVLTQLNSFKI